MNAQSHRAMGQAEVFGNPTEYAIVGRGRSQVQQELRTGGGVFVEVDSNGNDAGVERGPVDELRGGELGIEIELGRKQLEMRGGDGDFRSRIVPIGALVGRGGVG